MGIPLKQAKRSHKWVSRLQYPVDGMVGFLPCFLPEYVRLSAFGFRAAICALEMPGAWEANWTGRGVLSRFQRSSNSYHIYSEYYCPISTGFPSYKCWFRQDTTYSPQQEEKSARRFWKCTVEHAKISSVCGRRHKRGKIAKLSPVDNWKARWVPLS